MTAYRRILVVEDDPETAGQLVDSLKSSGYRVDWAASGSEALTRGVAADYAVITIDRMLPDIDGLAVMRQLRRAMSSDPASRRTGGPHAHVNGFRSRLSTPSA